ncbi:choice-of-anchor I domain-containing protein [Rivularia sp. UHCC 0363]|uniref:choice-of-anchor I domain-containing protein n=1 Tax=Rivularia sp. UHCC 0363 TaxID=3110244 RepID=UPI002B21C48E|nr:CHRD domain-containing protein [Rivularia sp. UHCC 0363]MEA5597415.1 CHRD domain-containing protein [Rivularia sp. UHCC 0363]
MLNLAGTIKLEGAEISAYDSGTKRIFVTGEAGANNVNSIVEGSPILQVVDIADPSKPVVINQIDLSSYGAGVQSVAVKNGVVAVAVSAETPTDPGKVVFFNASDSSFLSQVTVGALPDMLTFTPDGSKVLVANEGEPNDRFTVDPEGSVSIIDVSNRATPTVTTADFKAFNGQEADLRTKGVRIFGEKSDGTPSTAAEDFEPEYIAVSPDGTTAFVTLQENNAFAVVDIASSKVTSILPLGYKDWSGANPTLKPFKATFDGSQEVTPNTSTATGNALLQLNQAGNALNYTMTVSGLDFGTLAGGAAQTADTGDDVTGIHFHNAARGAGGLVVFGIFGPAQDTDDRTITINANGTTTISGVWETTDTAASTSLSNFVADLQAANTDEDVNLYFNIHTEEFPMGEIRGQIMGSTVQLDASNRDDGINFANYPNLFGMYQPDAIASYEANGETYYITANEGDARIRPDGDIEVDGSEIEEGADFNEEARVGDDEIILDPTAFPDAATLKEDENLGRLNITTTLGNTDNDPEFEELYAYGARSFSIFNSSGELVYDSGDLIGKLTSQLVREKFNSQGDADSFDSRSDDKGAEPEGVTIGQVGNKTYAYVGLERTGGVMVFDVSNPTAASFVQYINNEGDLSPEGLTFIDAQDSANGNSLLAVTNEVSETLSIYNANIPDTNDSDTFTLQLLHAADQEAGIPALDDAPRFSAVLNALKNQDADNDGSVDYENTVILSSGDAYIPGLFLNAAADPSLAPLLGKAGAGRADIVIQNELGFQAIAFGNHEFDLGTGFVASVLTPDGDYPGANFPYLSSNLNFTNNTDLAPLVTADGQEASTIPGKIAKSTVITVNGEKIGVVGATTPTLNRISSPGTVGVLPADSTDINALAAEIQKSVDALLAANPDLNKVILLAHMQQIAIEQELAGLLKNVDIIMAGGSNTRLVDETDRLRDGDTAQGVYPILKKSATGEDVAVINTDGNYKYVGRLVVDFDAQGRIIPQSINPDVSGAYATDDAGVAALNAENLVDPEIKAITDALRTVIQEQDGNVLGITDVFLNGARQDVRTQETNLGNLTADANLTYVKGLDSTVAVSIKNGGGIRNSIGRIFTPAGATESEKLPPEGNELSGKPDGGISQPDAQNALSFNNALTLLTVTAEQLKQVLEHGVSATAAGATPGQFPQIGGVSFSFDATKPAGQRIQSAAILNDDGTVKETLVKNGQVVGDTNRAIRIVTLNFLANDNGDGYPFTDFIKANPTFANRIDLLGETDKDLNFNGKIDAAVDPAKFDPGKSNFANSGSEQDAFAEYLLANFNTPETAFKVADVAPAEDMRIQNLAFRADTVLAGLMEPPVVQPPVEPPVVQPPVEPPVVEPPVVQPPVVEPPVVQPPVIEPPVIEPPVVEPPVVEPPVLENIIIGTDVNGTTVESIDLTGLTGQATVNFTISREANFNNEVYFYKVDNITGSVGGVKVGEAGYVTAALNNRVSPVFSTSDDNTQTGSAQFTAGSIVVPVIIADGTLAEAISGAAEVYFPYLGANTDNGNFDHIKFIGNNTFGFEDLANGGDKDFNDIVIKIESIA